jgi:hypothetical protein
MHSRFSLGCADKFPGKAILTERVTAFVQCGMPPRVGETGLVTSATLDHIKL